MTITKFAGHESAQAVKVRWDNGAQALVSYTTTVISIDEEGWLHVHGLYSRTTIKHISWFMQGLGFSYQLAKQLYNDRKDFNIYTGEVIDWE